MNWHNYVSDSLGLFFAGVYEFMYEISYYCSGIMLNQYSVPDKILLSFLSACVSLIILVYMFKFIWRLFRL